MRQEPFDVIAHLEKRIPHFVPEESPQRLSGGLLNFVWRVPGRPESLIVKQAPPYITTIPTEPFDQDRLVIEARALTAFQPGNRLSGLSTEAIRPPALIDFDRSASVLVMEDVGEAQDLGIWLLNESRRDHLDRPLRMARRIGRFLGGLHSASWNDASMARDLANPKVQGKRLEVQYRAVEPLCRRADLGDAAALGKKALELGHALLQPGRCAVMGDLWPPSLLIATKGVRIIDWELAHYGHPAQDVAHLTAHLWMLAHRSRDAAALAGSFSEAFLESYRMAVGRRFDRLFGSEGLGYSAVHFGAEILVRTVGAFQSGYLYDSLPPSDPAVKEAVQAAAEHIRDPLHGPVFAPLR